MIKKYRFIIIIIIVFALYFLDIECIFRLLYGVSCPGCGLTRAYKSILNLDLKSAFYYHPLFWTIPIILYLCIKKVDSKYLIVFIILFIIVYFIRLCDNNCDIVSINIEDSLLYKLLSKH